MLYQYEGDEPDVRRQFLMRGTLRKMTTQHLEVELRHPQRNHEIFDNPDSLFAVEHDRPEASTNRLFSGLYSFLTGNADRQDLLLNRRQPRRRPACQLVGDYGPFEELVRKERQADDIFFVIGPPGSGKTSFALRYMIEEELHDANSHILVMAYTNRAVDELCNMLDGICESGLLDDYVRLGSVFSASAEDRICPSFSFRTDGVSQEGRRYPSLCIPNACVCRNNFHHGFPNGTVEEYSF